MNYIPVSMYCEDQEQAISSTYTDVSFKLLSIICEVIGWVCNKWYQMQFYEYIGLSEY